MSSLTLRTLILTAAFRRPSNLLLRAVSARQKSQRGNVVIRLSTRAMTTRLFRSGSSVGLLRTLDTFQKFFRFPSHQIVMTHSLMSLVTMVMMRMQLRSLFKVALMSCTTHLL